MNKTLVALPLCLALLAACSSSSNSPKAPDVVLVPKNLEFSKPAAGSPLTKTQATEIKKAFTVKSMMILPPGELIFPDQDMSKEERQAKENDLARQDRNAYQLLMDIRGNCSKAHPTIGFDATFPTEQITGENAYDVLQAGDKISYNASAGITGANCPVSASGSASLAADVKSVNSQERTGSAAANTSMKLSAVMKNQRYAQLLGTRGMIVDTKLSGLTVVQDIVKGGSNRALLTFNLVGTYLSLNADIPYSTEVKVLADSQNSDQNADVEIVATTELSMPNQKASLVVHTKNSGDKVLVQEAYLNGNPVTQAELTDLFGENIPNGLGQATQIKSMVVN